MSARFPFSEETKPEKDSIVLIHAVVDETRKSGQYFIGLVLGYGKDWYGDDVISLMMYINNRETDASVKTKKYCLVDSYSINKNRTLVRKINN